MAEQIMLYGAPAVLLIIAIVNIFKFAGLPNKYAALVSLLLGLGAGQISAYEFQQSYLQGIVIGAVIGTTAAGTYSVAKSGFTQYLTCTGMVDSIREVDDGDKQ
jgi:NhaP-type Na+/H+ and K+/H+ antiporter